MFAIPFGSVVTLSTLLYSIFPACVRCDCECGYSVDSVLYTDLLESDFLHEHNITTDTDWEAQTYTIDAAIARGPYGKAASPTNLISNPLNSRKDWEGDGKLGGDAGLQLIVRGGIPSDGMVPIAEISTSRSDIYYGSFRAGMKLTGTNGTCGAFFWYFNDTQEIDMEFLSSQYNQSSTPVNLVLQSPESAKNGFNAVKTGTFDLQQLPFAPDQGFHEYRFDWFPDAVKFYVDGVWLQTMTKAIPTSPGHITISHWSNGDPQWSGGPPDHDAVTTVSYFKGYFNTSNSPRHKDWEKRCKDPTADKATCPVPEITANPDATKFFYGQEKNQTPNQTLSAAEKNQAGSLRWDSLCYLRSLSTVVVLFICAAFLKFDFIAL